jgi:hypothetical protein
MNIGKQLGRFTEHDNAVADTDRLFQLMRD